MLSKKLDGPDIPGIKKDDCGAATFCDFLLLDFVVVVVVVVVGRAKVALAVPVDVDLVILVRSAAIILLLPLRLFSTFSERLLGGDMPW